MLTAGIVIAILTLLAAVVVGVANGNTPAPSVNGVSPLPVMAIGFSVAILCIFFHFW